MKKITPLFLFLVTVIGFFQSATSVMAQTPSDPDAECVRDVFTIFNLPKDGKKVAVRIDNDKNAWNLNKPFQGDIAGTVTPEDGKYVANATYKDTYNWWVHIENKDGSYGKAYGGTVYCGNGAPQEFDYVCTDDTITFSWKPVEEAAFYAIRIDDKANSWNEEKPLEGDIMKNDIKELSYEVKTTEGKTYDAWIHAVDSEKHYSSAEKISVDCTSEGKKELTFWESIKAFFSSLFS